MRFLVVFCGLMTAACAQLSSTTLGSAKKGCDFGVPINGQIGWVKVPCDKTNEEAKKIGLGAGAEFLGSSRLSGFVGGEQYAIHGKVNGKCCSQRVEKSAQAQPWKTSDLCCHDTCPAWMKC